MPIYEYNCLDCDRKTEIFLRSEDSTIECEHCKSKNLKRLFSTFAIQTGRQKEIPPCATDCENGFNRGQCGSGMCGT